MAKTREANRNG